MSNQEVLYFSAYKVHEHLNCTQVFMDIYPSFHGHILKKKKKLKLFSLDFYNPPLYWLFPSILSTVTYILLLYLESFITLIVSEFWLVCRNFQVGLKYCTLTL